MIMKLSLKKLTSSYSFFGPTFDNTGVQRACLLAVRFFIEAAFKREQQMCKEEGIVIELKFQDSQRHLVPVEARNVWEDNSNILQAIDSQDVLSFLNSRVKAPFRTRKRAWASCHCWRSSAGCSLGATRLARGTLAVSKV